MIFLNLLYVFQDYSYWTRSVPMQHLTVHIALDQQVTIVAVNPIVANSNVIAVNNVNFKVWQLYFTLLFEQWFPLQLAFTLATSENHLVFVFMKFIIILIVL